MMRLVGFLPANDAHMRATIDAIAERLTDAHGLVYRHRAADGLAGEEGTFLLCTFWLPHAQALAGEVKRARQTFDRAIAYANDVGLLPQRADPATATWLGNPCGPSSGVKPWMSIVMNGECLPTRPPVCPRTMVGEAMLEFVLGGRFPL